jgi:hypothetical protein
MDFACRLAKAALPFLLQHALSFMLSVCSMQWHHLSLNLNLFKLSNNASLQVAVVPCVLLHQRRHCHCANDRIPCGLLVLGRTFVIELSLHLGLALEHTDSDLLFKFLLQWYKQ